MEEARPFPDTMPQITDSSDESSSEEEMSDSESDTDSELEQDDALPQTDTSSMSFEEILNLQNKVGTKAFSKTVRKSRGKLSGVSKKLDKNRPMEMSSKKAVPFLRKVVPAKKLIQRDPRFDDLSGDFKPEVFEKTYNFVDEIRKKEKEVVEKKLQKARDPALKEQLKQLLYRMNQQDIAAKKKKRLRDTHAEFKRHQRERAQQGMKPFFLKKGDIQKLALADKYQELKKKGKVEKFLSKKRKRNSIKDRRRLPSQQ